MSAGEHGGSPAGEDGGSPAGVDGGDGTDRCPACGAPLPDHSGVADGAGDNAGNVQRAGCMSCGLQLVRRRGGRWETIRG